MEQVMNLAKAKSTDLESAPLNPHTPRKRLCLPLSSLPDLNQTTSLFNWGQEGRKEEEDKEGGVWRLRVRNSK